MERERSGLHRGYLDEAVLAANSAEKLNREYVIEMKIEGECYKERGNEV